MYTEDKGMYFLKWLHWPISWRQESNSSIVTMKVVMCKILRTFMSSGRQLCVVCRSNPMDFYWGFAYIVLWCQFWNRGWIYLMFGWCVSRYLFYALTLKRLLTQLSKWPCRRHWLDPKVYLCDQERKSPFHLHKSGTKVTFSYNGWLCHSGKSL